MRLFWWIEDRISAVWSFLLVKVFEPIGYILEAFLDRGVYVIGAICGLVGGPLFLAVMINVMNTPDDALPGSRTVSAIIAAALSLMMFAAAAIFIWAYIDQGRRYGRVIRPSTRHRSVLDRL